VTKGDEETQEENNTKNIINLYFSKLSRFFVYEKKFGETYLSGHVFCLTVCPPVHIKLENRSTDFYDIVCGGVYYSVVAFEFRLNSDCNKESLARRHSHVFLGPPCVGGVILA
jgi:hypothetical protein